MSLNDGGFRLMVDERKMTGIKREEREMNE